MPFLVKYRILTPCFCVKYRVLHIFFVSLYAKADENGLCLSNQSEFHCIRLAPSLLTKYHRYG